MPSVTQANNVMPVYANDTTIVAVTRAGVALEDTNDLIVTCGNIIISITPINHQNECVTYSC